MEKELLFEGKENASSINVREFGPQGARLDVNLSGKVSGKVDGLIISTHNSLVKGDGTAEADMRSLIFSHGEPVFMLGMATGKIVDPAPISQVQIDVTFRTPSQRLSFLNTTKGWVEGLNNLSTGEFTFKVYAVK
jgi:hypothetical protein